MVVSLKGAGVTMNRIALFIPNFGGGGAERIMLRLANYFLTEGYLVDFIVIKDDGPYRALLPDRAQLVVLNTKKTIFAIPKLVQYLRRYKPDVLLSTLSTTNWVASFSVFLSFVNTRLVLRVAAVPFKQKNDALSLLLYYLDKLIYPIISKKAFSVIGISKGVTYGIVNNLGVSSSKVKTIYNPAYEKKILSQSAEPNFHPWFDSDEPVILSVARLEKQKDYPTLLKAFHIVRRSINAKLIILGEGPERVNIERKVAELQITDNVHLVGFVTNPFSYMARANVLVCSSIYEGFGNVLVESLALNTPVVSTDCDAGPSEILENGKWGRLVPVGNAQLLSNAIIETLKEDKRTDLQQHAMRYSIEYVGQQYLRAMGCL